MSREQYKNANQSYWDELVAIHASSEFYNLQAFKAGVSTLHSIETTEIEDVQGKHLLHLQCHFGLDTLSWARLGAKVVGVDFSEESDSACEFAGPGDGYLRTVHMQRRLRFTYQAETSIRYRVHLLRRVCLAAGPQPLGKGAGSVRQSHGLRLHCG